MYNKTFLKFRFRQFGKIVREIPLPYLLVLGGMLFILIYGLSEFTKKPEGALLTGSVSLLLIGILHYQRGDYHFIQLVEERPSRIFCMDYSLLTLPICILEIISGYFWVALLLLCGCWGISKLKQPHQTIGRGTTPPRFLPQEAFEWRAGIRKYGILLFTLYGCGYAFVWLPYLSFAFLWLMTCITGEFFCQAEPLQILCVKELPARQFLSWKIKTYIRLYLLAIAPVCGLYTVFHPADWILSLVFLLLGSLNIILMILSKYAAYVPNTKIRAGQVGIGFSLLGIALPFLAPITLFLLLKKYPVASRNLTSYLYAYS